MNIFNEKQRKAMTDGEYICSECGGLMEFEDEDQKKKFLNYKLEVEKIKFIYRFFGQKWVIFPFFRI